MVGKYECMKIQNTQQGFVTIGIAVVVFFAAVAIAAGAQFIGIGDLLSGSQGAQSERAFHAADSCVDEALVRLKRNSGYAGGTLSVGVDSCTIVVAGAGATRTITVTGTAQRSTRRLLVNVSISGSTVTITDWAEVTT